LGTGLTDRALRTCSAGTASRAGHACQLSAALQHLVGDLDELPHPVLGCRLMEPPGRHATLSARAMPVDQVQQRSPISSLVLTFGCKFACPYCPIPAYNQRQYRVKSGERIADEMWRLNQD
jgi:hypothetical protein